MRGPAALNKFLKSALFPIVIVVLLVFVAQRLVVSGEERAPAPSFSQFLVDLRADRVASATMRVDRLELEVTPKSGEGYSTGYPAEYSQALVGEFEASSTPLVVKPVPQTPWWSSLCVVAVCVVHRVWLFLMNRMQGGGRR